MMTAAPFGISSTVFAGLLLLLAGCASRVAAVAPEETVPVVSGKMTRGVIVATRPVTDIASIQAGLNGVLAALRETPVVPADTHATEYVVQRGDDVAVSIVTSVGSFSMGDRVEIIDGSPPELLHAN
jgi:ABC-type Fe3+-hydroxamate transport system substrate-binding protein